MSLRSVPNNPFESMELDTKSQTRVQNKMGAALFQSVSYVVYLTIR